MKQLIYIILLSCISLITAPAMADTTHTAIRGSYFGDVISCYEPQLNGQLSFKVWYKFVDTTTFDLSPTVLIPGDWNASYTNTYGQTYYPGDSITWTVTITYPTTNLPFYPQEIYIKQYANRFIRTYLNDTVYDEIGTTAMIYLTPYNTVEIWNLTDFQNLRRSWLYYEDNPNAQRIFIDSTSIPESNLGSYTINWDTIAWENDWQDDYREIEVEGLAYTVLMKPVSPDSMDYYDQIGDGPDSTDSKKWFTGRVKGRLMAYYNDDFGNPITYPLSGIRVKLMEKDLFWSQTFDSDYTDVDGYFDLYYNENQWSEGNNVELYLKFKSRTSDHYKIMSTTFIGSNYNHKTNQWSASENAGTMDRGNILLTGDGRYYYDAFRAVHWGNKGYMYFENNNISLGKKLRFNINAIGSWYNAYNVIATVNLSDDDANYENTPYHEFGHHTMFRMQNNNFTMPYGENGFNHNWWDENTSKLAWVEGWADFIQMVLDAAYYTEDYEYGYDEGGDQYEYRFHYSYPMWYITNGYRSEYYFACALYDLWDGPNKNLPIIVPHKSYHGWNETGQYYHSWATIDDVEFDFNTLCQPLIQHPSGSDKIRNLQMYVKYLIEIVNDCELTADISRTLQENRVQWNVHEYEWGWHNSNFNTDKLGVTEIFPEVPSLPGLPYSVIYDVTAYNKLSNNNYYWNNGGNCITDNIYLGIWDTYSNIYKTTNLFFNNENQGYSHRVFTTYGKNRIYISNGKLELGGVLTTANLNLGSESLLWNKNHGKIVVNDGCQLIVTSGGTLRLSSNSITEVYGTGQIVVKDGGYICIEPGAQILLQASNSYIILEDGAIIGTNPDLEDSPPSNCQMPGDIQHDGDGSIIYTCYLYASYTHVVEEIISSNTTWDNVSYQFKENLVINPNVELTITNNSHLEFSKEAQIIIKQGAILTVDSSSLTHLIQCNDKWQGIQVWGDRNASQYAPPGQPCAQGKLILNNNAVIENAVIAVDLWRPGYFETTGGIVYASNDAIFRNNAISVQALDYRNFLPGNSSVELDNLSNFNDCTFEITNAYLDDVTFYQHVILYFVKGIDFHACDFTVNSNISGVSQYSQAIFAFNAGLNVLAVCNSIFTPCADWDPCTFTGFYNAIEAQSDGSVSYTLLVNRAVFHDNIYGVKIEAMNNAVVLHSDFYIGENTVDICCAPAGIGIYLENATGFAFEENYFTKLLSSGTPGSANYIGVSINNTESSDEVYKNNFDDLSYANYSKGKNWGGNIYEGLTYFCNWNNDNYSDFYVGVDDNHIGGIQSTQGDDILATGNKFSPTATWHFFNDANHLIDYYYYNNGSNEEPNNNLIYNVTKYYIIYENLCSSHYDEDPPDDIILDSQEKLSAEQEYSTNLNNYNNVKSLYDNLIDGGSTNAELMDIQTAQPQDMWTLRAQLLGDSPHLSMEVLKEAADKTEVFTEAALFDILAANPDELKKEELMKYLEEKEDPLPAYMIDILRSVATGTTYKTVLQQQMARYNRSKTRAAHDIIRSNLNDSVSNNIELRNWLDNLGGLSADRQIIATYVQDGNLNSAYTLANILPQLYMLAGDELTEHNYFIDILSLHDTLSRQGRNIFQLDSNEIAALVIIADSSNSIAGTQARSILEAAYDYHYTNCPNIDSTAGYKNRRINMDALIKVYGIDISVKPNPAKQWAAFDYKLPEGKNLATITIRDVTGKIVEVLQVHGQQGQKLWDTRQIDHGVYIYTLEVAGIRKSGKIVINK